MGRGGSSSDAKAEAKTEADDAEADDVIVVTKRANAVLNFMVERWKKKERERERELYCVLYDDTEVRRNYVRL